MGYLHELAVVSCLVLACLHNQKVEINVTPDVTGDLLSVYFNEMENDFPSTLFLSIQLATSQSQLVLVSSCLSLLLILGWLIDNWGTESLNNC